MLFRQPCGKMEKTEEVPGMRKVRCYDCGRAYDYDEDCFCPNCGAFNQPQRSTRIGADGSVVRVDGINEVNHTNSFVHRELHEEKRERRRIGLDKGVQRIQRTTASRAAAAPKASPTSVLLQNQRGSRRQREKGNPLAAIVLVIILIVLFNLLPRIFFFF